MNFTDIEIATIHLCLNIQLGCVRSVEDITHILVLLAVISVQKKELRDLL